MPSKPTRRQLLAAGGTGTLAIAGGIAYFDPLGLLSSDTGNAPTDWIGTQSGSNADSQFVFFDRDTYGQVADRLRSDVRERWAGGRSLFRDDEVASAITPTDGLQWQTSEAMHVGVATAGTVDVDAMLAEDIPASTLRSRLKSEGLDVDVSVEQDRTHAGLDVYRQQFTPDGHVRAVAMDESTFVASPVYTSAETAVGHVTETVDAYTDGDGRLAATSDRFGRFVDLLDPGFAGRIQRIKIDHDTLAGVTIAVDGDSAVHREVVHDPDLVTADAGAYEDAVQGMIEEQASQSEEGGPAPEVSAEVSDGACVIEVTAPEERDNPLLDWLWNPTDQWLFANGAFTAE